MQANRPARVARRLAAPTAVGLPPPAQRETVFERPVDILRHPTDIFRWKDVHAALRPLLRSNRSPKPLSRGDQRWSLATLSPIHFIKPSTASSQHISYRRGSSLRLRHQVNHTIAPSVKLPMEARSVRISCPFTPNSRQRQGQVVTIAAPPTLPKHSWLRGCGCGSRDIDTSLPTRAILQPPYNGAPVVSRGSRRLQIPDVWANPELELQLRSLWGHALHCPGRRAQDDPGRNCQAAPFPWARVGARVLLPARSQVP